MVLITDNLLYDALALLATLVVAFILYAKWTYSYFTRKGLYQDQPTIPIGNALKVFKGEQIFGELWRDLYNTLKSKNLRHGGGYFMINKFYVPADLDIVKSILVTDFQNFIDHGMYINEKDDPVSANLFGIAGPKWKSMRAKLTPTFTSGKMKMMFDTLVEYSGTLDSMLNDFAEKEEALEIKDLLQKFTIDIIVSVAFGIESDSMKNPQSDFTKYAQMIFKMDLKEFIRNLAVFSLPHSLLHALKVIVWNKKSTDFFINVIKKNMEYREKNNIIRNDFFHLLLQLKNRGQISDDKKVTRDKESALEGLTFNELAAQAFVFFIAGYETSSTAMTFTILELAQRPDLQIKMRDEINSVLKKHDNKLTFDGLKEMTYMEQVLQESMRKHPPVAFIPRKCTKAYTIPGTDITIDEGVMVSISTLGIHNDPEIYPEPEKFDPDRFSPENQSTRHPFSWIPFGEGPRVCIGLRFGMMQAKVGLVTLLRNYSFTLNEKTSPPIKYDVKTLNVTSVDGGVWINVKKVN